MNEALNNPDIKNLFLPGETIYIQRHQSKDKRQQFLMSERKKKQMQFSQHFGMNMGMGMPMNMNMGMMYQQPYMPQNFRRTQPYHNQMMGPGQGMRGPKPMGQFQNRGPHGNRGPQQRGGMQNRGQQRPQQPQKKQPEPPKPIVSSVITPQQLKQRLADLLNMDHEKQRQILGEMLFPKIQQITPELAPKITGMLIDLEVPEVIELLEDPALLQERIEEAKELLNNPQ